VGDPAIDSDLRRRLELLGTQVELVDAFDGPGGIQAARLARVAELQRQNPGSFVPNQYDNPQNPAAYETVAEQLLITLGRVDRLVGPVGSGGSTCGTAAALRKAGNPVRLVGVDTPGSVIFGDHDGHRILRGLGSSIHPANVDHSAYDDVHWVGPEPAIHTTRQLYASRGMFVGPTSGAAYLVADWHAARDVDRITVALFPDDGFRYLSSVYSDRWLQAEGLSMAGLPAAPRSVGHPHEVAGPWSWMPWGRRSLDDVLHGTEGEGQRCVT
jgi:cysteine synthase A